MNVTVANVWNAITREGTHGLLLTLQLPSSKREPPSSDETRRILGSRVQIGVYVFCVGRLENHAVPAPLTAVITQFHSHLRRHVGISFQERVI